MRKAKKVQKFVLTKIFILNVAIALIASPHLDASQAKPSQAKPSLLTIQLHTGLN
jgi:hypothetical protein